MAHYVNRHYLAMVMMAVVADTASDIVLFELQHMYNAWR